jgi:hypothetical protein
MPAFFCLRVKYLTFESGGNAQYVEGQLKYVFINF